MNRPDPGSYREVGGFTGVVGHEVLTERVVIDVRAEERYTGEVEPVDPKAGHIPGAINIPLSLSLEEGQFKAASDLAGMFESFENPVVSCGSGVNACHSALAMVVAGLPMPDVYAGSFSDWSGRDLPVSSGPKP